MALASWVSNVSIEVNEVGGPSVPGWTQTIGLDWVFTPHDPMLPLTAYEVDYTIDGCGFTTTFTTSAAGGDITDASVLVDRSWALDFKSGTWVQPPPLVGSLIIDNIITDILLGISHYDPIADELSFMGAWGTETEQEMCFETVPVLGVDFSANPDFEFRVQNFPLSVLGQTYTLDEAAITGTFSPTGRTIEDATFTATGEVDQIAPITGLSSGALCLLLAGFGAPCGPCPFSPGQCVSLEVIDISAWETPGLVLQERTYHDVLFDPTCP